jgi:hypothetical protein
LTRALWRVIVGEQWETAMTFHGDYEAEFEIYEKVEDDWRSRFLGHMVGIDAFDAKARWMEAHKVEYHRYNKIFALRPYEEWK